MVLILGLLGCLKPAPALQNGGDRAIEVLCVVDSAGERPAAVAPATFARAIESAVALRHLQPAAVDPQLFETDGLFSKVRDTAHRAESLRLSISAPFLLVESAPLFYSELNGQYRWTVGVHLSLQGAQGSPSHAEFDVPVFLQYHHDAEPEAVTAAAPVVARRVGELVDNWLAGGG